MFFSVEIIYTTSYCALKRSYIEQDGDNSGIEDQFYIKYILYAKILRRGLRKQ